MRFPGLAIAIAIATGLLTANVAAAATVESQTGMVGPWSFTDTAETEGATCGYSRQYPPNSAYLRYMTVRPPKVYAEDRNPDRVDRRRITWKWKLQQSTFSSKTWSTVASSGAQSGIATQDAPADFSPLRIDYNVGTPEGSQDIYRAFVIIKWIRGDGTVEGTVKARIDYYKRKFPWGEERGASRCDAWRTSG